MVSRKCPEIARVWGFLWVPQIKLMGNGEFWCVPSCCESHGRRRPQAPGDPYIHAEGYPAGEMMHGPNALINETLPVVCIATQDPNDPARTSSTKRPSATSRKSPPAVAASSPSPSKATSAHAFLLLPLTLFLPLALSLGNFDGMGFSTSDSNASRLASIRI